MFDSQFLVTLFGHGTELEPGQMALRALVVFAVALVLIRAAGRGRSASARLSICA